MDLLFLPSYNTLLYHEDVECSYRVEVGVS